MDILQRNNVNISGHGDRTLVFVHGYGCDQNMWRFVAPHFQGSNRIVLYDLTGMGRSDITAYDFAAYRSLHRHAEDLAKILDHLDLTNCVLIGHSVGATIASLATLICPERIAGMAMVAPSPFFMNDRNYNGGFERETLNGLVALMDENFYGWTDQVAPLIAGQPSDGKVSEELTKSFCRTDPTISKHFGRVTFLSDHRDDMKRVETRTIVIQCAHDTLAPVAIGEWLSENMQNTKLKIIDATGHCPHLSHPELTMDALEEYLGEKA